MSDPIPRLNAALEGRYRIERELGEGGMATVYLARDERHNRNVALKVLKPELAAVVGAERFLAEIETTANLQHPHILPLFDSGEADGFLFYVMPYIEGETLRGKLDREKQLPVDEAVRIATNMAEALDYAHRQGVIHRDIKPANVLLQDGKPVISDFGIALAVSAAGGGRLTETGLSLGTPFYMSPEQATADRDPSPRSDVYSLACVLYEMIAGDPPHTGSSAQAVLAHILMDRPRPLHELRETVPPHVDAAVARALAKVPADRFESAAAFANALADVSFTHTSSATMPAGLQGMRPEPAARSVKGGRLAWGVTAAALAFAAWGWLRPAPPVPLLPAVRVNEVLEVPSGGTGHLVAISPDGRWLAYTGGGAGVTDNGLFVRRVDVAGWRLLEGSEGALMPAFSPDGGWIVFNQGERLRKIPVDGGPILDLASGGGLGNPSWSRDGFIYVAGTAGVLRVPEAGGSVDTLVADGRVRYAHPLPDGSGVLYSIFQGFETTEVLLHVLETGESKSLFTSGVDGRYVPTGHILYGHQSQTVMAVPFDLRRHEVTGAPAPVLPEVAVFSGGATQFAVSDHGTVVHLAPTGGAGSTSQLVLVGLDGVVEELPVAARPMRPTPRFSPDGRSIAFDDAGSIHVYDRELGTNAPLTFEDGSNYPLWSPNGDTLVFRTTVGTGIVAADGSGPAFLLLADSSARAFPHAWSPDGRTMAVRNNSSGSQDLFVYDRERGEVTPYLIGEWDEEAAALSPNGRWLAYASGESGPSEIMVRSFPEPGARFQVSVGGGQEPVWAPDGERIYYRAGTELLAADVRAGDDFELLGRDTALTDLGRMLSIPFSSSYDVHPGGEYFVFFMGEGSSPTSVGRGASVTIVTNWFTELRERLGEN